MLCILHSRHQFFEVILTLVLQLHGYIEAFVKLVASSHEGAGSNGYRKRCTLLKISTNEKMVVFGVIKEFHSHFVFQKSYLIFRSFLLVRDLAKRWRATTSFQL